MTSIAEAAVGKRVLVTLICNGTTDDSVDVARNTMERRGLAYTIHTIAHGDKSNAINQFIYALQQPAQYVGCVDAFVRIGSRTLHAFQDAYAQYPDAQILSSIALTGRTEPKRTRRILEVGGETTGQLYSLRSSFLARMRAADARLPLDLYRGDGLLGAMAAHDLDAAANPWDNARIKGVEHATYAFDPLSLHSPNDLRRQFNRKVRQMRGRLENAGIRAIVAKAPFTALPASADEIIASLLDTSGVPATAWLDRPFMALAIRRSRNRAPVDPARLVPHKVAEGGLPMPQEERREASPAEGAPLLVPV